MMGKKFKLELHSAHEPNTGSRELLLRLEATGEDGDFEPVETFGVTVQQAREVENQGDLIELAEAIDLLELDDDDPEPVETQTIEEIREVVLEHDHAVAGGYQIDIHDCDDPENVEAYDQNEVDGWPGY